MRFILAHDLGTSGNKATLYDEEGHLLKSRVSSYPTHFFNGNWAEQYPEDWWDAVCISTRELLEGEDASSIVCVSFSGHMMGCLPVDRNGVPLRAHILYCDQRAQEQEKVIREKIDPWEFYTTTGHRPSASYTLEKVMWLRKHEPDVYRSTYRFLNSKDYIVARLTGQLVTDYSDAGGTELFDINEMKWSEKIADALDVDLGKFPEAFNSTHVAGQVTAQAAEETGIPSGTPVCCGAGDGSAAGVGAGSLDSGMTYTSVGSSAWVATTTAKPFYDPQMRIPTFPHAIPGLYHSPGAMQTAGASFAWATHEIFGTAHQEDAGDPYAKMDVEIGDSPPGSRGVIFLPYLMGERAPWWDNDAKACYLGITQETVRGDLLRAVQEGVAFNLRIILDAYREYMEVPEMTFVGGAAKSAIWRGILADVFNMPVVSPANIEECASMGAAIIGAVGVGVLPDFKAAAPLFRTVSSTEPNKSEIRTYDGRFEVFVKSYHALRDVFPLL